MRLTGKTLEIIGAFGSDSSREMYVREIARYTGVSSSTALRQLNYLSEEKILTERKMGKELLFKLNPANVLTAKLCELDEASKTRGFLKKNRESRLVLDYIEESFKEKIGRGLTSLVLFGSTARGTATKQSDVDLLVITTTEVDRYPEWRKLADCISDEARIQYGRELAPIFISSPEFEEKLSEGDPFIKDVITEYIILAGYEYFIGQLLKR